MTTGAPHQPSSNRSRRSRGRTYGPPAVAAWLILEIWLLTLVADAFGVLTVFLLLLGGAVAGAYVIRRAGRRAWNGLTRNLQAARAAQGAGEPVDATARSEESTGNTLPMVGGLLLMTPGLLSDVAGLLCVFPPTRALLRRRLEDFLSRRMQRPGPGTFGDAFRQARVHRPGGTVVPGEVIRDGRQTDEESRGDGRPPLER